MSAVKPERVVADEELIPFEEGTFDLVISNLALHWVNDLPGVLAQIRRVLKPDGLFLASMFGEETLWELRNAFLVAEQDRDGGISNHVSPFAGVSDVGDLLTRAKFALPTSTLSSFHSHAHARTRTRTRTPNALLLLWVLAVDQEELVVDFADAFTLMRDLRGMGESNAQHFRRPYVPRSTMYAAAAAYKTLYGKEDGRVPATFQVGHTTTTIIINHLCAFITFLAFTLNTRAPRHTSGGVHDRVVSARVAAEAQGARQRPVLAQGVCPLGRRAQGGRRQRQRDRAGPTRRRP